MKHPSPLFPIAILCSLIFLSACTNTPQQTYAPQANTEQSIHQSPSTSDTSQSLDTVTPINSTVQNIEKSVSYRTPSGTVTTIFTIGLDTNKTITSLNASTNSRDHEDTMYAKRFSIGSTKSVVGKTISEITSLRAIGGASLTTQAFQEALK